MSALLVEYYQSTVIPENTRQVSRILGIPELRLSRMVLRIPWLDYARNEEVLKQMETKELERVFIIFRTHNEGSETGNFITHRTC